MSVKTAYLSLYNAASMAGWAYVLALSAQHFQAGGKPEGLYGAIEEPLKIVQTTAILEIAHAALGLVRSPVATTAIQVASRLIVLWGMVHISAASQSHWGFALMALSWATVEVPRYGYYLASLLMGSDRVPSWLTWLRYSMFMILYPTGITGECLSLWHSLDTVKERGIGEWALPNPHNIAFSYHTLLWVLLVVVYPPGSYVMFNHMAKQRRKVLGGGAGDKKAKAA